MTYNSFTYILLYSLTQGITEFIPVSSSGHLNIIENLFKGAQERNLLFETTAHLSTLLALLLYLIRFSPLKLNDLFLKNSKLIGISLIPALFMGMFIKILDINFLSLKMIAYTSISGAILLFAADKLKGIKIRTKSHLLDFFIAGLFQCLAFLPGFSRSGSCITAFLLLGHKKEQAIINSLLMSFPIIILSFVSNANDLEFIKIDLQLIFIFIISFITAYLTLIFFIKYINKVGFTPYVIYRVILGLSIIYYLN